MNGRTPWFDGSDLPRGKGYYELSIKRYAIIKAFWAGHNWLTKPGGFVIILDRDDYKWRGVTADAFANPAKYGL